MVKKTNQKMSKNMKIKNHFTEKGVQMADKHKERCLISLVTRQIKSKIIRKYQCTLIKAVTIKNIYNDIANAGKDEKKLFLIYLRPECQMVHPL